MTFEEETRAKFAVLIDKLNRIEANSATVTALAMTTTTQSAQAVAGAKAATEQAIAAIELALETRMMTKALIETLRREQ